MTKKVILFENLPLEKKIDHILSLLDSFKGKSLHRARYSSTGKIITIGIFLKKK